MERLLVSSVAESVADLDLRAADTAAVRLAERFASHIDSADDPAEALATFGPKLRQVLESLGATPRGRVGLSDEKGSHAGAGTLAALRASRQG